MRAQDVRRNSGGILDTLQSLVLHLHGVRGICDHVLLCWDSWLHGPFSSGWQWYEWQSSDARVTHHAV